MKNPSNNFIGKSCFLFLALVCFQWIFLMEASAQQVNSVPFKHRVGNPAPQNNIFKIKGDFAIIGNTSLTLLDYENKVNNSNNVMIYVDVDGDEKTVNSSTSSLVLSKENGADPNCSEIIYAGLYWSGRSRPGIGQMFDVVTGVEDGAPINVPAQNHVVLHEEPIPFSHYELSVSRIGSEDNFQPRFSFASRKGGDTYQFQFTNNVTNPVRYRVGTSGEYTTIPNQVTSTNGGIRTSTFEPFVILDGGMTIRIDGFQRNITTTGEVSDYQGEDTFAKVEVSGVFIPVVENKVTLDKTKVKLKGPGANAYTTVTASNNQILFPVDELEEMYAGYADITQYVKSHGIGDYTVADLALVEGNGGEVGYFGHWGIIVVYQNSAMNWRDVTIFDGYSFMRAPNDREPVNQELVISGFKAVENGPVNLKLGVMAGEGERGLSGDYLEIRNSANSEWVRLSHALNGPNNFFNSSIYTPVLDENNNLIENPRFPFLENNTGIDIAMWNVPNPNNSIIANGQTETTFRYGSNQDIYNIYTIAFSVDAYVPEIQGLNQIESINGQNPGENLTTQPGQEIAYTLEIKNLGTEHVQDGKVIIPIPFTTSFVSASHQIYFEPNTAKAPYFDSNFGPTGAIVWELGDLPLNGDSNFVLAKLSYTLKTTEDCLILSEADCEPFVSVNGIISGKGGISQTTFDGIQLTQGFLDGDCAGEPIQESLVVTIAGAAEWILENCPETDLFRDFNFCNIEDEAGIPVATISASFPVGVRFFNGPDPNRDREFSTQNPFPAVSGTYYAIPANSSACVYEFRLHVTNVTSIPAIPQASELAFCQGAEIAGLNTLILPSNAGSENAFQVFFFLDQHGGEALEDFQIDSDILGSKQIWVAEGTSAACLGERVPVTISINSCGIELEKKGSLLDIDDNGQVNAGDKILYQFIVKNTGSAPVLNINLSDPQVNIVGGPIEILGPGEVDSTTFSAEYILTQADIDAGSFTNTAAVAGNVDGQEVSDTDDDVQVFSNNSSVLVSKTSDTTEFTEIGQVITYTITVTNTGNTTLLNVSVKDPLTGLEELVPTLAPGQVVSFQTSYSVTIADIENGSILNTVLVAGEDSQGNPVEGSDTETVTAGKKEIIANDDAFGEFPVDFGGMFGNILANDLLEGKPVNWEEVNFEIVELDGILGLVLNEYGELSLVPGLNAEREYRLRYVLSEAQNPTNTDDAYITFRLVSTDVDLSVSKTSHGAEVIEGGEFEYEIVVRNIGGTVANNVVIVDDLPSGLTYVSSRIQSSPSNLQVNQVVTGPKLTYTVPVLPIGGVITIFIRVRANQLNGASQLNLVNRVVVSADERDFNPDDNDDEDVNTVKPFFIPNVITPNNDGKNDRFVIQGLQRFVTNEIVIMNRYGDHVFERKNYDNDWNADGLVAGTYFFVLKGTDAGGQVQEFKGWIQVIKD